MELVLGSGLLGGVDVLFEFGEKEKKTILRRYIF